MKGWIALNMTPGVGPRVATKLLEAFGSPENVFHARRAQLESLRIKPETIESIMSRELEARAAVELERVKKIALLDREFSIEAGEMTPSLKIKRNVVE